MLCLCSCIWINNFPDSSSTPKRGLELFVLLLPNEFGEWANWNKKKPPSATSSSSLLWYYYSQHHHHDHRIPSISRCSELFYSMWCMYLWSSPLTFVSDEANSNYDEAVELSLRGCSGSLQNLHSERDAHTITHYTWGRFFFTLVSLQKEVESISSLVATIWAFYCAIVKDTLLHRFIGLLLLVLLFRGAQWTKMFEAHSKWDLEEQWTIIIHLLILKTNHNRRRFYDEIPDS